jgi:hypothetical protein
MNSFSDNKKEQKRSNLGRIYEALSEKQEICVMPFSC